MGLVSDIQIYVIFLHFILVLIFLLILDYMIICSLLVGYYATCNGYFIKPSENEIPSDRRTSPVLLCHLISSISATTIDLSGSGIGFHKN